MSSGVRVRWLPFLLPLLTACDGDPAETSGTNPSAERRPAGSAAPTPGGFVLPPERIPITNPLQLSAREVRKPEKGQRIFVVPERMLKGARVGTAMKLRAAFAEGEEGDNLIVRIGTGKAFPIHPAYVVVPQRHKRMRPRRGTRVIASYHGELRHGVVKGLKGREKVTVRFTDVGAKREQAINIDRAGVLSGGLEPGAYAAHLAEHEFRHVLLVSPVTGTGKQWLVLRHSGEADLVDDEKLTPLPVARFKPKVGATVLAAWRGTMVRAQLKSVDRPGLFTVSRARAGAPFIVGPGMIMPTE